MPISSLPRLDTFDGQAVVAHDSQSKWSQKSSQSPVNISIVAQSVCLQIKGKQVLSNISFAAFAGELTAVVGPSGSGKTSLLNILSQRIGVSNCLLCGYRESSVTGIVKAILEPNDAVETQKTNALATKELPITFAYVPVMETFLEGLSVSEFINVAVDLKMRNLRRPDRKAITDGLLRDLELMPYKDTVVTARFATGVSLDVKKRLSLAIALVDQPSVLFVDEPTTGLDSRLSKEIVRILGRLAENRGTCVICTIHQPRPSTFEQFDKVLLLHDGKVVYYGLPSMVASHFESISGVKCPKSWSPIDYAVDAIWALSPIKKQELSFSPTSTLTSNSLVKNTLDKVESPNWKCELIDVAEAFRTSPIGRDRDELVSSLVKKPETSFYKPLQQSVSFTQWFQQVGILVKRSTKSHSRNWIEFSLLVIIALVQGLIVGAIFWQFPKVVEKMQPHQLADFATQYVPYNSSWYQMIVQGVDRHGYQPFLEAIDFGINSRGSDLEELFTLYNFEKVEEIVWKLHTNFSISDLGYPPLDFLDNLIVRTNLAASRILEERSSPLIATSEQQNSGEEAEMDLATSIARVYRVALQGLQLLDAGWRLTMNDNHFHLCQQYKGNMDNFPLFNNAENIHFYFCLLAQSQRVVDIILEALNFPEIGFFTQQFKPDIPGNDDVSESANSAGAPIRNLGSSLQNLPIFERETISQQRNAASAAAKSEQKTQQKTQHLAENSDVPHVMAMFLGSGRVSNIVKVVTEFYNWFDACDVEVCRMAKLKLKFTKLIGSFITDAYITVQVMLNVGAILFFICSLFGFAAYEVLFSFPKERRIFNRESHNGMYLPSSYYISKMIADLPFQLVPSSVLALVLYFCIGLHRCGYKSVGQFFAYWGVCILIIFCAYGFGYMVSALSSRLEVALFVAPALLVIWLCIAGFFLRDGDLPKWAAIFRLFAFFRWGFFGLASLLFPPCKFFGSLPNKLNLVLFGVVETRVWFNCLMLLGCGIFYRVLGFIFLKFLHTKY